MKKVMRNSLVPLLMLVWGASFAQPASSVPNVLDNTYVRENVPNRRVIPYAFLREADVIWSRRIWRIMDLKEKMNLPYFYPASPNASRKSLWDILYASIKSGELTVYEFNLFDIDHTFMEPMTKSKADSSLNKPIRVTDEQGNSSTQYQPYTSGDLSQYELKEDWFFDKQRSVLDVRILGICVVRKQFDDNGTEQPGTVPMFWMYFPQVRPLFSKAEVFNDKNDAERRTYEDMFWKRQFSSYIVQESNVYNRKVSDYLKNTLDALLEGESIKNNIATLENDMWQY